MNYRCIAAIPNDGGNCIQKFYEDTPEGLASAEAFAREHNKPGMGVYDCVAPLKEERRGKDTVAEIPGLHWDIDARHVNETKEQIVERARAKFDGFGILSKLVDSGRGIHVYSFFREPIVAGTPEAEAAERLLVRMIEHLGADPAPKHFAALMRRPGTTNSKEGGGPCQVILDTGVRCELSDIESYLDLIGDNTPLFTRKSSTETNGGAAPKNDGPVDVDARLAAMQFGNKDGFGVNATIPSVIGALIWKAWHPDDIYNRVMDALKEMVTRDGIKNWDWQDEEKTTVQRILSAYRNVFEKEYDHTIGVIPVWLPMEFHQAWAAILAEGRRPTLARNGSGFYVRRMRESGEKDDAANENTNGDAHTENEPPKDDAPQAPFVLRPFEPFDLAQLPTRDFLFGRHYQRRTVSGTVAPGGTGKSSLVMVESVAMATARGLLNEEVKQPLRVWYHNGEDNMLELKRRLGGICQHYGIPQDELKNRFFITSGNEVPLRVAESWNQVRLQTDHRLVKYITEAIGDNKVDVAILDPLVTLHGVAENNPGQMDSVIRIFTRLSDTQNCAIDLSHHTRKLGPGADTEDYTIDDMRGARAISDAMRAVRMLNFMSSKDAENAGLMEIERTTYFRIDRAKANYSAPSKTAIWRKFENVDLPNGDGVGVVTPWRFPGQDGGPPSPERLEAKRKAEHVFLEVLRRLFLAGRFVGERGAHNAPHVFAREREAKMAKVGKAALNAAMVRLFDRGKIRIEEYTLANRHPGTRIVEV